MLWHEKQDKVPVDDNIGSKNNILPNSTLTGVVGLLAGAGAWVDNAYQLAAKVVALINMSATGAIHREFIINSFRLK